MAKKPRTKVSGSSPSSKDIYTLISDLQAHENSIRHEYNRQKSESNALSRNLGMARTWDIRVKIGMRVILTLFFSGLLYVQNNSVFELINNLIVADQLKDNQWVIGTIISGTLTETYLVVRVIVKWAMQDIDYPPL